MMLWALAMLCCKTVRSCPANDVQLGGVKPDAHS